MKAYSACSFALYAVPWKFAGDFGAYKVFARDGINDAIESYSLEYENICLHNADLLETFI